MLVPRRAAVVASLVSGALSDIDRDGIDEMAVAPSMPCFLSSDEGRTIVVDQTLLGPCTPNGRRAPVTDACWDAESGGQALLCEHLLQLQAFDDICNEGPVNYSDLCTSSSSNEVKVVTATSDLHASVVSKSFPSVHRNVRCRGCAYEGSGDGGGVQEGEEFGGKLIVADAEGFSGFADGTVVAENRWSSFMGTSGLPIRTRLLSSLSLDGIKCDRTIDKPTFIFDFIGWHVGHLITDVLEPLFYALEQEGLLWSRDALLFVDVADKENVRHLVPSLFARDVYGDSAFRLLRKFTRFSLHTKRVLDMLPGHTCFTGMFHVQLDVAETFAIYGGNRLDGRWVHRARRYASFQSFLLHGEWARLGLTARTDETPMQRRKRVTVIRRVGSRTVLNLDAALEQLAKEESNAHLDIRVVQLERMAFSDQLLMLMNDTDLLVCQQGTGAHNTLFMNPSTSGSSSLVLLMQPGWCRWRWQFTDQALLLGIHAKVVCTGEETLDRDLELNYFLRQPGSHLTSNDRTLSRRTIYGPAARMRWHQRGWMQGPRHAKDADLVVNVRDFVSAVHSAASAGANNDTANETVWGQEPVQNKEDSEVVRVQAVVGDVQMDREKNRMKVVLEAAFFHPPSGSHVWPPDDATFARYMRSLDVCVRIHRPEMCAVESDRMGICFGSDAFNEHGWLELRLNRKMEALVIETWFQRRSGRPIEKLSRHNSSVFLGLPGPRPTASSNAHLVNESRIEILQGQTAVPHIVQTQLVLQSECEARLLRTCECVAEANQNRHAFPSLSQKQHKMVFFLHLEKTAGTCFRHMLWHYAKQARLPAYIPCHSGVNCATFDLEQLRNHNSVAPVVAGGHFAYGAWEALGIQEDAVLCLTIMRHPVSRVVSFYYERVFPSTKLFLNDVDPKTMARYMETWRGSAFGRWRDEGMANAGCKMMCGIREYTGLLPVQSPRTSQVPACTPVRAIERLGKCLVGIHEYWDDSLEFFKRHLPWLGTSLDAQCPATTTGSNKGHRVIEQDIDNGLNPQIRAVIEEYNQCDMALYREALAQFQDNL